MRPWIDIDAAEATCHPNLIDEIFAREVDGATLRGVFTTDECQRALASFEGRRRRGSGVDSMFGQMLGIPLADLATRVADPTERTLYLDDAEFNHLGLVEGFGFDPHDRVADLLGGVAGGRRIRVPDESGRPYASGNIRWFDRGAGGLPAHVDNEFKAYHDGTLAHLQTMAVTDGHLSWFVILQAPGKGGALSVYDELYRVHEPAESQWTDRGRNDADFEDLDARRISPSVGSLVVFGGGWRWHRVDDVTGVPARVTYGGFAADGVDRTDLYIWF